VDWPQGVEGGLQHMERGLQHVEGSFEQGVERLEGGIGEHIDKPDDGADVGTVLNMHLEKVESAIDTSLSNGFSPVEKGLEVGSHSGASKAQTRAE
jgi:hypothetical protein